MKNEVDYNAQARTNPIFLTAKTAICLMARAGISDADAIVRSLKLENNEPLKSMSDSDIILGNAIVVETKYRTMCRLIENSGYNICLDLPCGYTPKAIHLTKKNFRFVELDLPIVVQEISPIIYSLAKYPERINFCGVDATNYESLETAGNTATKQSNVANLYNSFIVDEKNLSDSLKTAENFLVKHGMNDEKINLAEHMPELNVYNKLTSKQILQFKDAMRNCNYWRITLDDTKNNFAMQKQRPFEMSYTLANKIFQMTLRGRVDSISAPKILMTWESEKKL